MASGILDDLVDLIGHQPAIELLRAWGGRRLKVPAEVHQDHALVFIVGWDAAGKLSRTYGGTDLDLPAERNVLVDMRNAAIMDGFKRGRSITWLSMTYGVSRRQVNSVLDRMGAQAERLARAAGTRT
jgi:lambda repressor-like predicted transcriptional regulator